MQITGITLNIMTLGGLAVAVGRVVDDAIVVLENIYRHRALGEDRLTASLNGPEEVAGAITASTLTTVAVFLPLGFVGGLVSQFFLPFALTVTFALLASLICALTVVPVLAYFLIDRVKLDVDENGEPTGSIWVRVYTPTITFALRTRATKFGVLAVAAVLFVARRCRWSRSLPTQFINAGSEKILQVTIAPPAGASSEAVLDDRHQGRDDPRRRPGRRARPDEHPRRGRHQLPDARRRAAGPAGQQRDDDRPARPEGRPRRQDDRRSPRRWRRSRPTATTSRSPRPAGFTSNGLNIIVSAEDPAAVATTTETVVDGARGRARPRQPQERPRQGHARDPGHRRSEQGHRGRPDRRAGRRRGPRRARRRRPRPR